jgi:hypothetical protein
MTFGQSQAPRYLTKIPHELMLILITKFIMQKLKDVAHTLTLRRD